MLRSKAYSPWKIEGTPFDVRSMGLENAPFGGISSIGIAVENAPFQQTI